MSGPRVLTRALGGSELARAAEVGAAPGGWYLPRPATPERWRERAERIRRDFAGRDWLSSLAPAIAAEGAARDRLERVAGGRGILVTTGQQPGLFGGPVYTWSKALSALALADAIERETGVPAAPLFWAATDDTDFAEASVTHVAVPGGVDTLAMTEDPATRGLAMRDVPLGDVAPLLARLERGAGSATWPRALEVARASYEPGATVGGAYLALLRALIEPLGIAVLDASHPAMRAAARPLLERALAAGDAIEDALEARDAEIVAEGFEPQVALVRGLSLVFAARGGGARERVPIGDAAAAAARDGSLELGPNVLLRPIVERALLPTASYVAGPGEIAYFAQCSAVAAALGEEAPLVVPRWSGLVVEPHVERLLDRLGLEIDQLRDPHAAEGRIAAERLGDRAGAALDAARRRAGEAVETLRAGLVEGDGALLPPPVLDGLRRDFERRLDRVERRAVAASKRRHADLMRDVATARGALWPLGRAQERTLNPLPMLARHGAALLDAMLARAREHAAGLVGGAGGPARELREAGTEDPRVASSARD